MARKSTEKRFERQVKDAGLTVLQPVAIKSPYPVMNKHGREKKTVTTPDCQVQDPNTKQKIHVEVTDGAGNNPHKEAQQRVVNAAGVENYVVITGDQITLLEKQKTAEAKRQLLFHFFGWIILNQIPY